MLILTSKRQFSCGKGVCCVVVSTSLRTRRHWGQASLTPFHAPLSLAMRGEGTGRYIWWIGAKGTREKKRGKNVDGLEGWTHRQVEMQTYRTHSQRLVCHADERWLWIHTEILDLENVSKHGSSPKAFFNHLLRWSGLKTYSVLIFF